MASIADLLEDRDEEASEGVPFEKLEAAGIALEAIDVDDHKALEAIQVGAEFRGRDGRTYIRDRAFRVFAVPSGNCEDYDDLYNMDEMIPNPEPGFEYELRRLNEVPLLVAQGFAVTKREDVGMVPDQVTEEYGKSVDTSYKLYDSVVMKIPKALADARRRAKERRSIENLLQLEPTDDAVERARVAGFPVKVTRKSSLTKHLRSYEKQQALAAGRKG